MLHTNGKSSLHVIFSTDSTLYIHGLFKRIKTHCITNNFFKVRNHKEPMLSESSCVAGMNTSPWRSTSYLCLEGDISHSVGPRPCPHYSSKAAWWGGQTAGACTAFRNWQAGNRALSLPRSQGCPLKQRDKAWRHPRNDKNQFDVSHKY